jgi:hypothetical protein
MQSRTFINFFALVGELQASILSVIALFVIIFRNSFQYIPITLSI